MIANAIDLLSIVSIPKHLQLYTGAYTATRQNLQQKSVFDSAIYDMGLFHTASERFDTGIDFRDHTPYDSAILFQLFGTGYTEIAQ
jgi:hypothetical protein